ncbi:MAG: hypothetical protein COV55_03005 [Candidatus Komeilibacteria bacterium CG11_big_fil_rev_8_21_14_0_20_36_20]|uniref:RNA polymerase sigma factor n=1 Tax=Candidatus Komeilibacteria bacterium CG11_big_fil_rev_8_21_14_0_20_36_20 TaxID=1974477 RepID=A0A2H0NE82_9BACT|nr:MAG: hypothetical protein COV55_03005 [Candidatus Komeilibacteria bacterium CG11_big_fil_rev_8_21_14_0_20_36_20]PIR81748.1 MAG: hypothetical protein COU21_01745 [Candidatus Komeilibacteria bacterium CG10_big_fil_rev_8_21_14_0_10_36_65]PJC55565.1 MAG: hypothetical protein CO027_01370 [Candidatus Komeilibacteria bacterium CG_4_9_14_0_2_um_filter_36_13]
MTEFDHQSKTDEELVEFALQKSDNFLYLMKRYETRLLRYIQRISNFSPEDAEDILQEVFLKVYQNLNNFDSGLKFSSWIYRITHNQVISTFRKSKARPEEITFEVGPILEKISNDFDIDKKIDSQYLKKNIAELLNALDDKYKEVLILKYLEGKDYKEISDILKKPVGTVSTLLNRAKKQFREKIQTKNIKL